MLEAQPVECDLRVGPGVVQAGLHRDGAGGVVGGVLLDAEVGRDLADDVAHNGRDDFAGEVAHRARVVEHDKDFDLGVVDRQHGGKTHRFVVIAVIALVTVGAFGRTGLAADAVARHISVFVGMGTVRRFAVGVDAFLHHRQQLFADFFGDDLPADLCLGLLDLVAVGVGDGIHHIGRDQVPAVGDGRHRRSHLHRRDGLVLAERRRVEVGVDGFHLLGTVDAGPARLVGQVDAGGLGEAERLRVVVQHGGLQRLRGLDEPQVAAVVERAGHIQLAVRGIVGAAVGVLPLLRILVDNERPVAVKRLVGAHNAGVKARRRCDELEHRTGHIQLGDVFILPLGLAHHTLQAGVLAADLVAVLVDGRLAADLGVLNDVGDFILAQAALEPVDVLLVEFLFVEDGLHFFVVDLVRVVGVELFQRRHCQDRAGIDVHDDGAAAAVYREVLHRLGQVFLHDGLHILVDG